MAPHTPSAWFRRSGRTAADNSVSERGMMRAPPAPCTARAVTSQPTDGDNAAAAEAPVKTTRPDEEHPAAAEPVAEGGPGEQQHGEGEGVGVDRPLEAGQAGVEVAADDGEGGGHHQVVERGHEQRQRGDHHGPTGAASGSSRDSTTSD